jgi:diguanylate cyclase (GGDEF)-like protein
MSADLTALLPTALAVAVAAALAGAAWERWRMRERLRQPLWRDPQTGLWGRATLLDALARELALADRQRHAVSLLMLEIDDYARLSRQLGPESSAALRLALVQRLGSRLRAHDLLGQWSESRFLVLLPASDVGAALVLAQDLREVAAQQPLALAGQDLAVSLSAGVHGCLPGGLQRLQGRASAMAAGAERALERTLADGPGRMAVEP